MKSTQYQQAFLSPCKWVETVLQIVKFAAFGIQSGLSITVLLLSGRGFEKQSFIFYLRENVSKSFETEKKLVDYPEREQKVILLCIDKYYLYIYFLFPKKVPVNIIGKDLEHIGATTMRSYIIWFQNKETTLNEKWPVNGHSLEVHL